MSARIWLVACFAVCFLVSGGVVAQERQTPQNQTEVLLSYAPVVKLVAPSVVNVYATTITQQAASPFANDPFFQRFFGNNSPLMQRRPKETQSLGSGVIVDAIGIILTNSHVVADATDIRISLADTREYEVDLLLDDPKTDLAVLRIRDTGGKSFPALEFANSDNLEVGDLVLALGNPFGVGQTVTSGIVSALARTGVQTSDYGFFIQTDAAINPGNSGGALVDMRGKLVGINSAIFTRSGGSLGIGFAIPGNMARIVAEAGAKDGQIIRPWFGALMQAVTTDIADSLGIDPPRGALITEIAKDGPADIAGLLSGDVIISLDSVAIGDPPSFDYRMATKPIGGEAVVEFVRGGKTRMAHVKLEPFPEDRFSLQAEISGNTRFAGVTAQVLNPVLAQELGLSLDTKGIVLVDVIAGSPAVRLGLRKGDVILELNGQKMTDLDRFGSLASTRPRAWQIVLRRGNQIIRSTVPG